MSSHEYGNQSQGFEIRLTNWQELEPSQEGSRFRLLEEVDKFQASYGFLGNLMEFAESEGMRIADNPDLIYPIIFTGLPGSGKSVLEWQFLNYVLRESGDVAKRMRQDNYELRLDILPWGDSFKFFPEGDTPNKDLTPERLQSQLNKASYIYGNTVQKIFSGYYFNPEDVLGIREPAFEILNPKKKYIRIVAMEIPTKAGILLKGHEIVKGLNMASVFPEEFNEWDQLDEDEQVHYNDHKNRWGFAYPIQKVGFLRARVLLRNLVSGKGMFKNFKGAYANPRFVDVVASHNVRMIAARNRVRLNLFRILQESTEEKDVVKREKILKNLQMNFNLLEREVRTYGSEDATVSDMRQIDDCADDVVFALSKTGEVCFDEFEIFGDYAPFNRPGLLRAFPTDRKRGVEIRAKILGEDVAPWTFINEVDVESINLEYARNNIIVVFNRDPVEKVVVEDIRKQRFPIREIYGELEKKRRKIV